MQVLHNIAQQQYLHTTRVEHWEQWSLELQVLEVTTFLGTQTFIACSMKFAKAWE